jgi:TRAP-type C4-dicarboxylate transport system substrate-binding protein
MKLNRVVLSLLVGLGVITTAAVQAQAQMVLKLAEIHAQGYPTELADEEFARLVNQYTGGTLKVDVFPGGQITGDEKVAIEQVQISAVAIGRVSTGALGSFNPQMNVFGLPYIFDSKDHMWAFLNGTYGQKMLADLASSRMIGLCWYDGGSRSFYAKTPLTKLEDLKGLKIRTQTNPLIMKMVESMRPRTIRRPCSPRTTTRSPATTCWTITSACPRCSS